MQVEGVNLVVCPPSVEKLTVPVGMIGVPASVSVTVAVQVVGAFTGTAEGEQTTDVDAARVVAAVGNSGAVLPACDASPP